MGEAWGGLEIANCKSQIGYWGRAARWQMADFRWSIFDGRFSMLGSFDERGNRELEIGHCKLGIGYWGTAGDGR